MFLTNNRRSFGFFLLAIAEVFIMASQGPRFSTSESDSLGNFVNLSNVRAAGGGTADCDFSLGDSTTLDVTGFGFSIPAGSSIDEIFIEIDAKTNALGNINFLAWAKKPSGISANSFSDSGFLATSTTLTNYNAGSLWGETWSLSDVNSSAFGVEILFTQQSSGAGGIVYVDFIRVTVFYTPAVAAVGADRSASQMAAVATVISNPRLNDRGESQFNSLASSKCQGAIKIASAARATTDTSHVLFAAALFESATWDKSSPGILAGAKATFESENSVGGTVSIIGTPLASLAGSFSVSIFYASPADVSLAEGFALLRTANWSKQAGAQRYAEARLRSMSQASDHFPLITTASQHLLSESSAADCVPAISLAKTASKIETASFSNSRSRVSVAATALSATVNRIVAASKQLAQAMGLSRVSASQQSVTASSPRLQILSETATANYGNESTAAAATLREFSYGESVFQPLIVIPAAWLSRSGNGIKGGAVSLCCGAFIDETVDRSESQARVNIQASIRDYVASIGRSVWTSLAQTQSQNLTATAARSRPVALAEPSLNSITVDRASGFMVSTAELAIHDLAVSQSRSSISAKSTAPPVYSRTVSRDWLLQFFSESVAAIGTGPAKGIVRTTPVVSGTLHGYPVVSGIVRTFDPAAEA